MDELTNEMEAELTKTKSECERRVEEARQDIEYTGANSEADEDKLAILLNNATLNLKVKNLTKANERH